MARGPKKHLKRLAAPKHWMLDKLGGTWAPRPSAGPHKLRECLPLILLLRNRLRYALTRAEVMSIVKGRMIEVDGKVRTDLTYPAGFMDVITIPKTNEHFRLLYDVKGRFCLEKVSAKEAAFKLCKVKRAQLGPKGIPYVALHDSRTIRYPDPLIKVGDTVKVDIKNNKIVDHLKTDIGSLVMVTGGHNIGRIGVLERKEKHPGSFEISHIKDAAGHTFATRAGNTFTIGHAKKAAIPLPKKGEGVKLSIAKDRERRIKRAKKSA